MRLIVDTNRIIAALIKNSTSRKIIMSRKLELVTIGLSKLGIVKYRDEILKKSNLNVEELDKLLAIIWGKIYIVEDFVIKKKINEAIQIMQEIDPSDTLFIALALSIKNDGMWSEDKHFALQKEIKVWKTKDLLKYL